MFSTKRKSCINFWQKSVKIADSWSQLQIQNFKNALDIDFWIFCNTLEKGL